MAYNEKEDSVEAQFNDALGQSQRINKLRESIIAAKQNLFMVNEYGVYHFEQWLTCIKCLWQEGRVKCNQTEIDFIERLLLLINRTIETSYPIQIYSIEDIPTKCINYQNWKLVEPLLSKLEEQINALLDLHGLGNPTKEREYGL